MKVVVVALFVAFAAAPDDGDAPAPSQHVLQAQGAEIRCQRVKEPGSLVKRRKICLTEAEWAKLAEAAQRKSEELRMNNLGGADGCKVGQPC